MTRIVGLDVALGATGVARVDGTFETIKPARALKDYHRHAYVLEAIARSVIAQRPDVVVLEDYAPRSIGITATIRAAEIGGMLRAELTTGRLGALYRWVAVKPNTLKLYATGKGNARKEAMADAATVELDLLGVPESRRPRNFDEVDAYWLRSMAAAYYDDGAVFGPELEHRTNAVEAVVWPDLEEDPDA